MNLFKILSRRTLPITILAGIALCVALFFHFTSTEPIKNSSGAPTKTAPALSKPEQANFELPVRLIIPGINVDAAIESVGIRSNGEMDVPKSPANAAWYNKGPRPGEKGSAVLDGHFGYKDNVPAVFDNLSKLQTGDKVYVKDKNGVINTFIVRESRNYDPKANTSGIFLSNDGKAHLNLITCEGAWDTALKGYTSRLVVFTDKE